MHKINEICERLEESIKHEFDNGIQNINVAEMGEAIDMYKDLMCAKKDYYEAKYYESIVEAMEEYEEEEEKDGKKYYGGRARDSKGRYVSRVGGRRGYDEMVYPQHNDPRWLRDMDRDDMHRMYYGGMTEPKMMYERDTREGKSGQSRKYYIESKEMHKDHETTKKELERYMNELSSDITELINDSTEEEKAIMRNKLSELSKKIM